MDSQNRPPFHSHECGSFHSFSIPSFPSTKTASQLNLEEILSGEVEELAQAFPDFVAPQFGVHPWQGSR